MKIDHLGFAVPDLEEGLSVWRDLFGLEASPPETVIPEMNFAVSRICSMTSATDAS